MGHYFLETQYCVNETEAYTYLRHVWKVCNPPDVVVSRRGSKHPYPPGSSQFNAHGLPSDGHKLYIYLFSSAGCRKLPDLSQVRLQLLDS